jgi:hypothetical protein
MPKTWEKVIIILISVLTIMGIIGHYEKKAAKQTRYITELTQKNAGVSKWFHQTKKDFTKCKEEKERLKSNCYLLYRKCKEAVRQCDDIITNKKNCVYRQHYLRRL